MLSPRRLLLMVASLLVSTGSVEAQMVEAPLYTNWSRFPVGTVVTLRTMTETEQGNETEESFTTQRLVLVDEKKLEVEQVFLETTGASPTEETSQTLTHRRWFPLLGGMKKEDIGKPSGAIAQGEETIELAGETFETQWYDLKSQTEAGPALTRTWISDKVPGKVVKAVTRVEASNKTITIELVKITKP